MIEPRRSRSPAAARASVPVCLTVVARPELVGAWLGAAVGVGATQGFTAALGSRLGRALSDGR